MALDSHGYMASCLLTEPSSLPSSLLTHYFPSSPQISVYRIAGFKTVSVFHCEFFLDPCLTNRYSKGFSIVHGIF